MHPELARLWRVSPESRLGRPSELDVDTVVGQAVALADQDGLAAVTLPKIAKALGYTPMSLYRYVGSKDELFVLMADFALGPPPDLEARSERAEPAEAAGSTETGGWRSRLRRWALAQAEVYRRHPWLVRVPISGPPRGPHQIGWLDAGLRSLRDTGLGWAAKVGIMNVLGGYVRTACQLEQDLRERGRDAGAGDARTVRDYGRAMARLVDPERFPDAARLFSGGLFEAVPAQPEPSDRDFTFGLELILDGVAATIREEES